MLRYDAMGQPAAAAPSAGYSTTPAGSSNGDRVVITAASANAYQGPNNSSPVAFSLASGKIVEVALRAGSWIQVRDDQGRTGWIPADSALAVQ